jgi:protein phosphatase
MATPDTTTGEKDSSEHPTLVGPTVALAKPVTVRLELGAKTHVGNVRPNNEDQYLILYFGKALAVLDSSLPAEQRVRLTDHEGHGLLVADGMGGHAAGEHASALVVNEVLKYALETAKWFFRLDDPDENVRVRLLREVLQRIDRDLVEEGRRDPTRLGMGTTLTAATIIGNGAFIVHVGDSRAYLLRNGQLIQLTRDHTHAQDMVDRGKLSPEEAQKHRLRHLLSNTLGGMPGVEPDIIKVYLADGDRLLLCTDGLTDPVSDGEITEILKANPEAKGACGALVDAALARGGPDNVTVVLANSSIKEVPAV